MSLNISEKMTKLCLYAILSSYRFHIATRFCTASNNNEIKAKPKDTIRVFCLFVFY